MLPERDALKPKALRCVVESDALRILLEGK